MVKEHHEAPQKAPHKAHGNVIDTAHLHAQGHRDVHAEAKHKATAKIHEEVVKTRAKEHKSAKPDHAEPKKLAHPKPEAKLTHDFKADQRAGKSVLPPLKITGFDPGECLRGEASHYGKGDGFYGKERRDGTIHKPGHTAAMRLADAENITVSVRNLSTGASSRLLVNDFGPRADTNRLIDINSFMRKPLLDNATTKHLEGTAQVEVCRLK